MEVGTPDREPGESAPFPRAGATGTGFPGGGFAPGPLSQSGRLPHPRSGRRRGRGVAGQGSLPSSGPGRRSPDRTAGHRLVAGGDHRGPASVPGQDLGTPLLGRAGRLPTSSPGSWPAWRPPRTGPVTPSPSTSASGSRSSASSPTPTARASPTSSWPSAPGHTPSSLPPRLSCGNRRLARATRARSSDSLQRWGVRLDVREKEPEPGRSNHLPR